MKSLDEILYDGLEFILSKILHANKEVDYVTDLTAEEIDKLIELYGIKGVILDIDETIRYCCKPVPVENDVWLNMLVSKLKVIVLSNGCDSSIALYLRSKNIDYIYFAFKPLKKGFMQACNKLGLKPEEVLVIGDDIYCDIYGGKKNNMTTVKVNGYQKYKKLY